MHTYAHKTVCLCVKLCVSHVPAHLAWVKQALTGIVPHTHIVFTFIQCLNGILIKRHVVGTQSSECVCCNHSLIDQCHVLISLRLSLSLSLELTEELPLLNTLFSLQIACQAMHYIQDTASFSSIKADNHIKHINSRDLGFVWLCTKTHVRMGVYIAKLAKKKRYRKKSKLNLQWCFWSKFIFFLRTFRSTYRCKFLYENKISPKI